MAKQEKDKRAEYGLPPLPDKVAKAATALGLKPEHVLDFREHSAGVSIVTRGGRRLAYPEDTKEINGQPSRASLLTPADKGDA